MKNIAIAFTAIATIIASTSSAHAVCKKPVGRYAGVGGGFTYNATEGTTDDATVLASSINVASNGSVTGYELGKSYSNGVYGLNFTVASWDHTFNPATCIGSVTTNYGTTYTYTSTGSGSVLNLIYTKNDPLFVDGTFRLERQ